MKKIQTVRAPEAIGPYSQAVVSCGFLFTSGQIAIQPDNGLMADNDIAAQTARVCENLKALLEEAGASFKNVIKTTCYLNDMADFATFNGVYERYFTSKPARSTVAAKSLPKGALVEIDLIAELEK